MAAILVGLALGVPIGVMTAVGRNTAVDDAGRVLSLVGLSLPAFDLGTVL
ncbi:MAG: ABC transporter permease, partial [Chloroflexota bacterium]